VERGAVEAERGAAAKEVGPPRNTRRKKSERIE